MRAIEPGSSHAVVNIQDLTEDIQQVTSQRSNHSAPPSLVRDLTFHRPHSLLPPHSQDAPLMDKRVEIHGTSRADMNGKCGVATDFHWYEDESKDRYTVKLDGGEAFKVKLASVRAEGVGGGDGGGGGGAGKGKGKKRRGARK